VNLVVTLPLKIESTANKREHWSRRASRAKAHRSAGYYALREQDCMPLFRRDTPPMTVTLTRIAPRELDSDNLAISFKSVRDGIADWLGVKDNDKRITWVYAQEKGAPKHYAARIEVKA
jgi:hypothetical protein